MKSNYHNVSFFFQKVLGSFYIFLIFFLAFFFYLFANNCHVSYFKRLKKSEKRDIKELMKIICTKVI